MEKAEAIVDKLGGMESADRLLADELIPVELASLKSANITVVGGVVLTVTDWDARIPFGASEKDEEWYR